MKNLPPALISLFNSGNDYQMADLWTFTLSGGLQLRYTSHDRSLVVDGNNFASGVLVKRGAIIEKRGLETSTLNIEISADDLDLINNVPFIQFVSQKGFDGANVLLERVFYNDWGQAAVGKITRFAGKITSINKISGNSISLVAKSWAILLNTKMPSRIYQAGCSHTVYDAGCGLNAASFSASGAVTGTPTRTDFNSGISATNDDYALGKVLFTSGANNGLYMSIKSNAGGHFYLESSLPQAPSVGDTFTVYKGCDWTAGTCATKFNNKNNFDGTPLVPAPETAFG